MTLLTTLLELLGLPSRWQVLWHQVFAALLLPVLLLGIADWGVRRLRQR